MSEILLLKLDNVVEGIVVKRPSKHVKTPYVADVKIINGEEEEEVLGHTPALGCCGLCETNSSVLMTVNQPKKTETKCSHTIYLSILRENEYTQIVGIHPKLAETLTEASLRNNLLTKLQNIRSYRREVVIYMPGKVDSRFDFTGVDKDGIPFIMEVKNVPLADYEDLGHKERGHKEREKMNFSDREYNSKVAYFPDGYRKKVTDTVSPRALKHIRELTIMKEEGKESIRCLMCYVMQRTDINRFQPSVVDPEYRDAFKRALNVGVEIITLVVSWNAEGEAYFVRDDLPITDL